MSLDKSLKNLAFDKRMIEWNLTQNLITKSEIKKHLDSLEDFSQSSQPLFEAEKPTAPQEE